MPKKEEHSKFYPRLFFSLLLILTLLICFLIIKPFLIAFLTGGVLAVLSYPLYSFLQKRIKRDWIAALLATLLVALLLLIPLALMLNVLSEEAYQLYKSINGNQITFGSNLEKILCEGDGGVSCDILTRFVGFLPEPDLDYYVNSLLSRVAVFITENFSEMIFSLPIITLNFFVMLFVMYYVLKDHRVIIAKVNSILPLRSPHKSHVIKKFKDVSFAVFYGHLFVAIIQGVVAGVGYFLLGVKSPFLWAALTMLFALLPFLGTALIWLPLAANFLFSGYVSNDSSLMLNGILLLLYGLVIVSTIDNILRPKIISTHANVHPILVLLGVLGGLSLFGFVGLILGPVLLSLLMILVEIYEEEKSEIASYFQ